MRADVEAGATRPPLDRPKVRVARFVWRDDEPRIGNLFADASPGGKQVLFIGRPGRAGNQSRPRRTQRPYQSRRRPVRARPHLVVAGVTRHSDPVAAHALLAEPLGVLLVDGAHALDRAIRISQRGAREYTAPAGGFRECGADHSHRNPGCRGSLGERRPDVELAEHERARRKRREYPVRVVEGVEGQIIDKIRGQGARKGFGARREEGVRDLGVWTSRPNQLDDRQSLQTLTDRRRVKPH